MKKLILLIIIPAFFPFQIFTNPISPAGLIVEVYFEDDNWFLVADNYYMEMYGIQTFDEVSISCYDGTLDFRFDFLPDFSSSTTIITQDALVNTISINPIEDHIWVNSAGGYSYHELEWGPTQQDGVSGPLPGQSLVMCLFCVSASYDYVWETVKGDEPNCFISWCDRTGTFTGSVQDQNGVGIAGAEIIYLHDYLYSGGFEIHHIFTDDSGLYYYDYMYAKNYQISKVVVGDLDYEINEFISIEPNETTTLDVEVIIAGQDEIHNNDAVSFSNSPNPFSGKTTFDIVLPVQNVHENPVLIVRDMLGKILSIVEINKSELNDNRCLIHWENRASLPSGTYIVSLQAENKILATHKMTIKL